MSNIVDDLIEIVPDLELYSHLVDNSLSFKGKSLNEWIEEIVLPPLHDKMSHAEIQAFNYVFVNINQLVMSNLALAKAYFDMATAEYNSALRKVQNKTLADIQANPNRRMPGKDSLENLAALGCSKESTAMEISQIFYEFWKIHADKMKMMDSRLNNINYMARN